MTPSRVLVTGASRELGAAFVRRLTADPAVRAVVALDTRAPDGDLGGAEFVRADIRNPLIAKVIAASGIDTVVHLSVAPSPVLAGGRAAMKELNVIGTMQLLAACQQAASVRTLVVRSSTRVYGRSARDAAVVSEDAEPRRVPTSGYAKDAVEVEGYVRGFARRRPDVAVSVLRFAELVGPQVDSALTRYFGSPVASTVLGDDPRLQMCHEQDALAVLQLAAAGGHEGTFNVAGDGVLLLSQALRRLGRPSVPLSLPAGAAFGRLLDVLRSDLLSPDQTGQLGYGRVVDTSALRREFGYEPATTAAAFEDYAAAHPGPLRRVPVAALAEAGALQLLERRRTARA